MIIYCCACEKDVDAALVSGKDVYPHRIDLAGLPFWQCPACQNFVGCHHKTKDKTRPLGVIATQAIKDLRKQIHAILDPIWKEGLMSRAKVYAEMSASIGRTYHSAELRNESEAELALAAARCISRSARTRSTPTAKEEGK